jgi:hypothetical protein
MRLYLDTSIIGGNFDAEFKDWTEPLIVDILDGKHVAVISEITIREIQDAPGYVIKLLEQLLTSHGEFITANSETKTLAGHYIKDGALTKKSLEDANHIAMATYYQVNTIVSWNFKHMVNVDKIRLFNSVNLRYGYGLIDIRSPREIIGL